MESGEERGRGWRRGEGGEEQLKAKEWHNTYAKETYLGHILLPYIYKLLEDHNKGKLPF